MSECLISRRGGGNSKILNLDKPPIIAKSNLAGELTGNSYNRAMENVVVRINDVTIFRVMNGHLDTCGVTRFELACTSIGNNALQNCPEITSLSLPSCTTIGSQGLSGSSLRSIYLPVCTTIGKAAFRYCYNLTSLSLPVCTTIGGSALNYCYNLTSLSLPACTTIGEDAIGYCYNLTSLAIGSNIQTIDAYAFRNTQSGIVISINRAQNAVSGAPWGASNADIRWIGDA